MLLNVSNPKPVIVHREELTTPEEFTYLGSTVRYDHHAKVMEMDWARHEERAGQHHSHSPSLNTWRKGEEAMQHTCGTIQKLARNRHTLRSFIAALRATRHDGHEWLNVLSQFLDIFFHFYWMYRCIVKMVIMYIVVQTIIQIVTIVIRVAL